MLVWTDLFSPITSWSMITVLLAQYVIWTIAQVFVAGVYTWRNGPDDEGRSISKMLETVPAWTVYALGVLAAPFFEESIFRVIPALVVVALLGVGPVAMLTVAVVLTVTTISWAWGHKPRTPLVTLSHVVSGVPLITPILGFALTGTWWLLVLPYAIHAVHNCWVLSIVVLKRDLPQLRRAFG